MEFLNLDTENIVYYIFAAAVVLIAFLLIKKIASCLIKGVILAVIVAILAFVYFNYLTIEDVDDIQNTEIVDGN